ERDPVVHPRRPRHPRGRGGLLHERARDRGGGGLQRGVPAVLHQHPPAVARRAAVHTEAAAGAGARSAAGSGGGPVVMAVFAAILLGSGLLYALAVGSFAVGFRRVVRKDAGNGPTEPLPFVSVIIPARDEAAAITNCLDSVF